MASTTPGDTPALPPDASPDWWSEASANLRAAEYEIRETTPTAAGSSLFQAPNRAQSFRTHFDENGIRLTPRNGGAWEWRLTLTEVGAPEDLRPVSAAERVVDGNRIEYHRDGVVEWYINDERGLEQGFTLAAAPEGVTDRLV